MTTKYLLPCSCGEKLVVDNRQAGQSVQCSCGSRLEVPTMRGLAGLTRLDADQVQTKKRAWGPRQGLFFIGLLTAAVAFGYSAYLFFFGPALDLEKIHTGMLKLPPVQTWLWWKYLSNWVPGTPSIDHLTNDVQIMEARRSMYAAIGVGIGALLVAASGLLIRPARR